ncbi:MAG: Gfo/Idh/MocA family oxidoreductase [Bryobacterales bacterium]|nr:Gfo/Idh/MocA family oxidoreductase [Bryobacterales bacterium]
MAETRRGFVRKTMAGAVTAASYRQILGANDRVRLGLIGYGLIGAFHVKTYKKHADAEWVAASDAYAPRLDAAKADCGPQCKGYPDFRALLDVKEIDAVVVATPDHWHALHTILACEAGKDVYVEKPMTLFVKEGRAMTNAARRFGRMVQVGTQGRSAPYLPEMQRHFDEGGLGKIHAARIGTFRNIMPGFGSPADTNPPEGLNYEMWLGPAPKRPYNPHRSLYHFRWFWDYSGGQMTNLGAHDLDFVHNLLHLKAPERVYCTGGRYALTDDNGETPDTQDAILSYPGGITVTITVREASAGRKQGGGTEIFGTKGSATVGRNGYQFYPDNRIDPASAIPAWSRVPGHPTASDFRPVPWTNAYGVKSEVELLDLHSRHFLDSIRSRKLPIADVETGHEIATACHLANLSMRLGRPIHWDAAKEDVIGDREASAALERPYRKPWDDVLRRLKL